MLHPWLYPNLSVIVTPYRNHCALGAWCSVVRCPVTAALLQTSPATSAAVTGYNSNDSPCIAIVALWVYHIHVYTAHLVVGLTAISIHDTNISTSAAEYSSTN
jgi:hypothetical protein